MKWGNFFFLDTLAGISAVEMPVFRYSRLKSANPEKNYIEYPVSVTFSGSVISFLYHQHFSIFGKGKTSSDDKRTQYPPVNDVNIELFSINLADHDKESLALTLSVIYKQEIEKNLFKTEKEERCFYSEEGFQYKDKSCFYGNLPIFTEDLKEFDNELPRRKRTGDEDACRSKLKSPQVAGNLPKEIKYLNRQLLLDFLFDLYHSSIFEHSKHFSELKASIEGSLIMQALISKAEFYYYAAIINDLNPKELSPTQVNAQLISHYYKSFIQCKYNWCKIIRNPESVEIFRLNNTWFSSPVASGLEKEMCTLLKEWERIEVKKKKSGSKKDVDPTILFFKELEEQISDQNYKWFLRRYNIKRAALVFPDFQKKGKSIIKVGFLLVFSLLTNVLLSYFIIGQWPIISSSDIYVTIILNILGFISSSVISIVLYLGLISLGRNKGVFNLLIPRALFSMLPTLYFSLFASDSYNLFWDISVPQSLGIALGAIVLLLIFVNNEVRSMASDILPKNLLARSIGVIFITFLFSITINYYAHIKYMRNMNDCSDVVIEYAHKFVSKPVNKYVSSSDVAQICKILDSTGIRNKKEILTDLFVQWKSSKKIDFPIYLIENKRDFVPMHLRLGPNDKPVFLPGYFMLSCVISILLSIIIQLILDERAITEPL